MYINVHSTLKMFWAKQANYLMMYTVYNLKSSLIHFLYVLLSAPIMELYLMVTRGAVVKIKSGSRKHNMLSQKGIQIVLQTLGICGSTQTK